jgi:large subunit ribosomal protein L20
MLNKTKVFQLAKGFVGRAKNCWRTAKPRVEKALQYAYRDRRTKKRIVRRLWISQINGATRQYGIAYSEFMHGLVRNNIALNRKMLASLAVTEPYSFAALVDQVQSTGPWRDIRAKRTTAIPNKVRFTPYSWSDFTQQLELEEKIRDIPENPWTLETAFNKYFAPAIKKAEEQNKKDLAAGKLKRSNPVYLMSAEEKKKFKAARAAEKEKERKRKEAMRQ